MRTLHVAKFLFAATAFTALAAATPVLADDVITFDSLATQPIESSETTFQFANGNSSTFDGVTFSTNAGVYGDGYYGILTPVSGHYGLLNDDGAAVTLTTTKILESAYIGQTGGDYETYTSSSVTINALNGSTILGSVTASPSSPTMSFVDTSSFAALTGITGYSFVPASVAGHPFFTGDDFTFTNPPAVPEPSAWSVFALFAAGIAGLTFKRSKSKAC